MVLPVGAPSSVIDSKKVSRSTSQTRGKTSQQGAPPQMVIAPPMFMQHVTPNVQTDVHIGLTPKGGGGFFASGLLRTRQRPRALSMLPLTASNSQEDIGGHEKAPLITGGKPQKGKPQVRQKYYPLSQEETLELLYLLNQGATLVNVYVQPIALSSVSLYGLREFSITLIEV